MAQSLQVALDAIFGRSSDMPQGSVEVKGYDFNKGLNYEALVASLYTTGFQAMHFGQAVEEVNRMLNCRRQPLSGVSEYIEEMYKPRTNCSIFLAYTSNMVSSGVREVIRFLVQHKMVDVLVTTGGGVEEDFIKCMSPTYLGDFRLEGARLRKEGLNRIGNLIVPNKNYCFFEEWLHPILDKMLLEQQKDGVNWTPSKLIARLGCEINNPESIYYWAYVNNIPVFSPAITDGAIGDNVYFHSYKNPGLRIDIAEDVRRINDIAMHCKNSGMIAVGSGLVKHHICNANLMRNGADYSVFINTSHEFDGSDAGAHPEEAVSWGKIKLTARPVKVVGDATFLFPLLVAETFAKDFHSKQMVNEKDASAKENCHPASY